MKHSRDAVWVGKDGFLVEYNDNGRGVHRYWSPSQIEAVRTRFPNTDTKDLAHEIGMTPDLVRKKAKELGVAKDKDYISSLQREKCRLNNLTVKRRPTTHNGKIHDYIKNETEEQRKKRIEKSAYTRRHSYKKRTIVMTEEQKAIKSQRCSEIRRRAIENGAVEKFKATCANMPKARKDLWNLRRKIAQIKVNERKQEILAMQRSMLPEA